MNPFPTIAPDITNVHPAGAFIGGPDLIMHVYGTGFGPGSIIFFNGGEETTTFVSVNELTTIVKPSTASMEITVPIQVKNGEVESGNAWFTFADRDRYEAVKARRNL